MNPSDFKIGAKLGAAFVVVVAMSIAMGLYALSKVSAVNANVQDIATNWLPTVKVLGQMQNAVNDMRRAQGRHVMSPAAADKDTAEKRIDTAKARLAKLEAEYAKEITAQEKDTYAAYQQHRDAYFTTSATLQQKSREGNGNNEEARLYFNGDSSASLNAVLADLDKLTDINNQGSDDAYKASEATYAQARNWIVGVIVAVAAIAIWLGLWVTRLITRPMAQAVSAAERIAAGDLTVTLHAQGSDETAQLLKAMAHMKDNLAGIVQRVRGNAEGVAAASSEIAQGNHDLSARTEQQASALQQTAASMEELSTTVTQNADNAQSANRLSHTASSVAAQGGEVVGQVVETMKGINASSRRIADIIGVIDGIAFQTNILALNAAVEAARAGEQGRGFAVVAAEVRSLASRSAEAAKEIKGLINTSVQQVEQGSTLVDRAGSTMGDVVASIRRVTDIMGEISAASSEQSQGMHQIDEAVQQMDHATQQNAALVEEMAAAASSLKMQAQELVQAVAVFKVDAHAFSAAAVQRPLAPSTPPLRLAG